MSLICKVSTIYPTLLQSIRYSTTLNFEKSSPKPWNLPYGYQANTVNRNT